MERQLDDWERIADDYRAKLKAIWQEADASGNWAQFGAAMNSVFVEFVVSMGREVAPEVVKGFAQLVAVGLTMMEQAQANERLH